MWLSGGSAMATRCGGTAPKSGVAIALSEQLSRCVAPGGVILGRRYPSRILMVRLRCQPVDVILVSVYLPHDGRTNPETLARNPISNPNHRL
eukprot:COSAG03_NODE_1029_length_4991_cov_62.803557_3_plen_92_part_00